MIPILAGLSDLQRQAGKVFEPIKNGSDEIIFLTERNDIFGVSMSLEHYKSLVQAAKRLEGDFWTSASESAMEFWKDESNNIYETLL